MTGEIDARVIYQHHFRIFYIDQISAPLINCQHILIHIETWVMSFLLHKNAKISHAEVGPKNILLCEYAKDPPL